MIRETIGRNVKTYRKFQRLSQESLAAMAGLHRTYIGSVERSERNVSVDNVERIAKALAVPVANLFVDRKNT